MPRPRWVDSFALCLLHKDGPCEDTYETLVMNPLMWIKLCLMAHNPLSPASYSQFFSMGERPAVLNEMLCIRLEDKHHNALFKMGLPLEVRAQWVVKGIMKTPPEDPREHLFMSLGNSGVEFATPAEWANNYIVPTIRAWSPEADAYCTAMGVYQVNVDDALSLP